jgi:hypothetical protein
MLIEEIVEGYTTTWGRGKKGVVRRYRCTDGPKKGRVVAKPSTCNTGVNQRKSASLKKTRRTKGKVQATKRAIRMKHPTSKRVVRLNKSTRPRQKKRR